MGNSPKLAAAETCPGGRASGRVQGRKINEGTRRRVRHQPGHGVVPPSPGWGPSPSARARRRADGRGDRPLRGRLVIGEARRTVRRQRRHDPQGATTSRSRDPTTTRRTPTEATPGLMTATVSAYGTSYAAGHSYELIPRSGVSRSRRRTESPTTRHVPGYSHPLAIEAGSPAHVEHAGAHAYVCFRTIDGSHRRVVVIVSVGVESVRPPYDLSRTRHRPS